MAVEDFSLKTLPHDLQAEKSVLGAVLVNNATFESLSIMLRPEDFFRRAHRDIFAAMFRLMGVPNGQVDLVTIMDDLTRKGLLDESGGPAYISQLTDGLPRSSNAMHYARIVKEKSQARQIIRMATELLEKAYDGEEAESLIKKADRQIIELQRTGLDPHRLISLEEGSASLYSYLEARVQSPGVNGIPTGFKSIDELTFGWQRGDLIVLAARPSMGKSAFVLNTALAAAKSGHRVGIFSLEMRRRQLETRLISNISKVDCSSILGGYVSDDRLDLVCRAMANMQALPIHIDDRAGQSVQEIRSACRRLKSDAGLDLVVIDYVQLIPGSSERRGVTRNEEVTDISRRLKVLADEVSVPILLLSQLSRAGEQRQNKRPILSDLRESGALEQDADIVMFLHRAHHRANGKTECIIEKQRNGSAGTVDLSIDRETQTFTDMGLAVENKEYPPDPEGSTSRKKKGLPLLSSE
jgi:replicative DNA helicase